MFAACYVFTCLHHQSTFNQPLTGKVQHVLCEHLITDMVAIVHPSDNTILHVHCMGMCFIVNVVGAMVMEWKEGRWI